MFMINISCYSVKTVEGENETCTLMPEIKPDPLYDVLPIIGESKRAVNVMCSRQQTVFTENLGQLENNEVMFYAQDDAVWFGADGVFFEFRENDESRGQGSQLRGQGGVRFGNGEPGMGNWISELTMNNYELTTSEYRRVVLKQEFVGANEVQPIGRERLSWNCNFFYGNDSSKWCTDVPNYSEVWFENIYDGIDLRYYSNEKGLKYDFIVHPGGNPKAIRIRYVGVEKLELDKSGNLKINTEIEDLFDSKPIIYQNYNRQKKFISGHFKIFNNNEYGFEIKDEFARDEILIIDPIVQINYSTFIGGLGYDIVGSDISIDSNNNIYLSGCTNSYDFPTTPGVYNNSLSSNYDICVLKLNHNGTDLVFSTYIGGNDRDFDPELARDNFNNSYIVVGFTTSEDFPIHHAIQGDYKGATDFFVMKINTSGFENIRNSWIAAVIIVSIVFVFAGISVAIILVKRKHNAK